MKTDGILYRSSDKAHSSERFLSKAELRELFPTDKWVVMEITYVRKSLKRHKPKEWGGKGKTSKKEMFMKTGYPKSSQKSRVINLF